ncbi:LPXTG cell wall anchor domain-containing protein [Aerococcus sanguinicola]|uniref:LPXTG cell wall anchor domain-containing protein n=2 Tax=Aerococcus TaxID=1375 RepID=A0A5N1GLA8_9LACT|nr:LPXTG cell wall anchor domain-containing protein [Aerococcus sanguinicola]KAA9301765.1 LPXTG cell wall anchor domain-containing protein [Aerococcus sanguinicola]
MHTPQFFCTKSSRFLLSLMASGAIFVAANEVQAAETASHPGSVDSQTSSILSSGAESRSLPASSVEAPGQIIDDPAIPNQGRWTSGEVHVHTTSSNDANASYNEFENILNAAYREDVDQIPAAGQASLDHNGGFDYLMVADHLRKSSRNPQGQEEVTPQYKVIEQQVESFNQLKEAGKYKGKIFYSGFEWDMFQLDHGTVGIIEAGSNRVPIEAIQEFEWKFAYDTPTEVFHNNEQEKFGDRQNEKADINNTFKGLHWLQENYPKSIVIANHPSRHAEGSGEVRIEHLRKMHDTAPDVFIGLEGMPGNQLGYDRAELPNGYTLGGADKMIAEVGGVWDALLGEGRHLYNFANSDFHFKVSDNRFYSSGYWPSEYSRTYTYVEGNTFEDVADGMRAGQSFSVYGDLITGLEFSIEQADQKAVMGGDLKAQHGQDARLVIRFKEGTVNNYKPITPDHQSVVTNQPQLDHIDVISGRILGPSADKTQATNPTAEVIYRIDRDQFGEKDAEGYYTVILPIQVDQDRYYRLRGTNHGLNVPGETDAEGNPLPDYHLTKPQQEEGESDASYVERMAVHLNEVNDRNYSDLWFYSNPIFVWAQAPEAPTEPDSGSSYNPSQSSLGTDTAPKPSHDQPAPQQTDLQPEKAAKAKQDPTNQPTLGQGKQMPTSIEEGKAKPDHQANSQAPHGMGALATASHQPAEPTQVAKKPSTQSKLPQTGAYTIAGLGLSLVAIGSLLSFKARRH